MAFVPWKLGCNPQQIRNEVLASPLDFIKVSARGVWIVGSLGWYGTSLLIDRIFSRDDPTIVLSSANWVFAFPKTAACQFVK